MHCIQKAQASYNEASVETLFVRHTRPGKLASPTSITLKERGRTCMQASRLCMSRNESVQQMSSTGNCKNWQNSTLAATWLDIFSNRPGRAPATCGDSEGGMVSYAIIVRQSVYSIKSMVVVVVQKRGLHGSEKDGGRRRGYKRGEQRRGCVVVSSPPGPLTPTPQRPLFGQFSTKKV